MDRQLSRLAALIFDVDGTLAETEEMHRQTFNEAFAARGLDWHWDPALYGKLLLVTGGKERIRHFADSLDPRPVLDDTAIAALHADKTARYNKRVVQGGITLRPGVARLVAEAAASGLRLAIATTTSRTNVDVLLAATIGAGAFQVIAAGDEVAAKKPAPDIYLRALARLELPAGSCLAFEDTGNGLQSALGASIECIVTTSTYGGTGPFPGALAVVDNLGDPGVPAHALAGPKLDRGLVDVAQLIRWRERQA